MKQIDLSDAAKGLIEAKRQVDHEDRIRARSLEEQAERAGDVGDYQTMRELENDARDRDRENLKRSYWRHTSSTFTGGPR